MRIEKLRHVNGGGLRGALAGYGAFGVGEDRTSKGDSSRRQRPTRSREGSTPERSRDGVPLGPNSDILSNAIAVLFAELVKRDHVTVATRRWATHTVRRTERQRTASTELTFAGSVSGVDIKAQTFSVKNTVKGENVEMRFHFNPATRLYIGGEETGLLAQLRPGEIVTVTYESTDTTTHNVKHVKKSA